MNNKSYTKKVYYNISMIDLTEKHKIKEFKIEIIKNLIKNYDEYHIKEFKYYNCEETYRTIRLLENIRIFLESLR